MAGARPSKISDEAILAAVPHAQNLRQLLLALGVAAYGGNYEVMRERLVRLGLDDPRFARRPRTAVPDVTQAELEQAVRRADSWAQAARLLGLGESAWAQRRVKRLAQDAGLDASHFLGRAAMRGHRAGGITPVPLDEVLVAGRPTKTSSLRKRLLACGLLLHECSSCERADWEGAPIPLELDHVNGDRSDNRLDNLRLLCPNCHAQTDTYRGRNIGAPRPAAAQPEAPRELPAVRARRRLALLFS